MGWFASKILRWVGMEAGSTKADLELASTGVDLVPGSESTNMDPGSVGDGLAGVHCGEEGPGN